jgi:signal transduction histidine kinase
LGFVFEDIQIFCLATAAVVDTALLLVLLERHNWRQVTVPLLLLVTGVWLLHVGTFVRTLLADAIGHWAARLQWLSMMAMVCGLILMPCAMLHGVARLARTGFDAAVSVNHFYALAYLPLVTCVPVAWCLAADPMRLFLELLSTLVAPYVGWLVFVNGVAAFALLRLRSKFELAWARPFASLFAIALLVLAAIHAFVFFVARDRWPAWEPYWLLVAVLSPLVLALLFAYFIMRFHFIRIALERTFVYGVLVIAVLLFNHLFFRDIWDGLGDQYHVDFAIVAWAAIIAFILIHHPLRQRMAESLRYLMGERVAELRRETRRLAVEMSELTGQPIEQVVAWFNESVRAALGVSHVSVWLANNGVARPESAKGVVVADDYPPRPSPTQGVPHRSSHLRDDTAAALYRELSGRGALAATWRDTPTLVAKQLLENCNASLAVVLSHPNVSGIVLFGQRKRNRDFSDEQINAIVMLVEQLGITLNNSLLQGDRLAAERRALQHDKLSTLGLITGSIAHEVKNPLSSIKTIASVLAEELGPGGEHAEDFRLLLGEVDRLSNTVTQLLQFARPSNLVAGDVAVADVLGSTLRIMRHVANQRGVTIDSDFAADLPRVRASEDALREVFFNLLLNSIDAAGAGGRVSLVCRRDGHHVVAQISDAGPGIPPEVQDRLFEPFTTTKQNGTGLGLYIVGRRTRELGGEIHCETASGVGTKFTVRLPCVIESQDVARFQPSAVG